MAATSKQLALGPLPLQTVSGAPNALSGAMNALSAQPETARNSVNPTGLALRALGKAGIPAKNAASDMGISALLFSRQFNEHTEEHPSLKRMAGLPREFWREFALLLCEDLGLSVAGPDVERHALADVLQACAAYVRVLSR